MSLKYVNRRGDCYYVLQGHTKTGKPKYYCARRASAAGTPVERVPDGFEIHEQPENAMVSIRRIRESRIQPFECEQLAQWAGELATVPVIIDRDGDHLIIYAADTDLDGAIRAIKFLSTRLRGVEEYRERIARNSRYSPMFRFTLQDENKRLYSVQRWCYLGTIDRWVSLRDINHLEHLAQTFLPHLGQESFFELM